MGTVELTCVGLLVLGLAFVFIWVPTSVGLRAQERGYSFFQWFVGALLAPPLALGFALAALPDRSIERRRRLELEWLELELSELAARGRLPPGTESQAPVAGGTIGNDVTL